MNTDGIIYVPQSDTYRITVGKRIVEVKAQTLKQAHSIEMVKAALRDGSNRLKNDFLDSIVRLGGKLVDDPLVNNHEQIHSSAWDSLYRQLEPNNPIDALYRGVIDPRDTVVACMDLPKPTPYYDPSAAPTVYYNDRFPSVPASSIIDEAIKLLNAKKNLHMTKLSQFQIFEGFKILIRSDMPVVQGSDKTLLVLIKHAAFDRAHRTDIAMQAGLKAKLDTDTYIKLRIAFLLYEALKADNNKSIDSDIFEIISSNVRHVVWGGNYE